MSHLAIPIVPLLTYRPLRPRCQHCQKYQRSRPRGLCRRCHRDKSIRRRYPPVSPHGRRQPAWMSRVGPRPLSPSPTSAPPGSAEKMLVMAERIDQGYQPCHPDDAVRDPEAAQVYSRWGR